MAEGPSSKGAGKHPHRKSSGSTQTRNRSESSARENEHNASRMHAKSGGSDRKTPARSDESESERE